jgi:hypothetical protein
MVIPGNTRTMDNSELEPISIKILIRKQPVQTTRPAAQKNRSTLVEEHGIQKRAFVTTEMKGMRASRSFHHTKGWRFLSWNRSPSNLRTNTETENQMKRHADTPLGWPNSDNPEPSGNPCRPRDRGRCPPSEGAMLHALQLGLREPL